jgi:hypothetical protein
MTEPSSLLKQQVELLVNEIGLPPCLDHWESMKLRLKEEPATPPIQLEPVPSTKQPTSNNPAALSSGDAMEIDTQTVAPIGDSQPTPTSATSNQSDNQNSSWRKLAYLLLDEIKQHKHGHVFLSGNHFKSLEIGGRPYLDLVRQPLDLSVINQRLRDRTIKNIHEFHRDILLMCQNAMMVNGEESQLYGFAKELKHFADGKILTLIQTERRWREKHGSVSSSVDSRRASQESL